ncbi:MAG: AAA family ATPase [Fulvivirga sp.]
MKPIARNITPQILTALSISPVVFLNGVRQAGKSTLAQSIRDKVGTTQNPAAYVSFDKPTQMAAAASSPEAFLSSYSNNLIIDEVQMVPQLFRTLKIMVDELRLKDLAKANGKYLLIGSANILALPQLSDALVGRMSVLTLYPFCTAEASGGKGNGLTRILDMEYSSMNDQGLKLTEAIKLATFPEVINMDNNQRVMWFDGYLTTLLQRDIHMLAELEKIAVLPNLLRYWLPGPEILSMTLIYLVL